jgi:hypothetical protein
MATKFLTNLDLVNNQILNGTFEKLGTDPSTNLFEGRMIYHTGDDAVKYYTGAAWETLINGVTSAGTYSSALTVGESNAGEITLTLNLADGSNAGLLTSAFYTLLNNATASNTNGTLAKRDANGRLQVTAPENDLDAANKAYVDAARSGLDVKQSAKLATNAALSGYTFLSNVLTASANAALVVDGTTLTRGVDEGIRILVKNETSSNEPYNGIYTVTDAGDGSNPWVLTRASDADASSEVTPGLFVFVEQGTAWSDSGWVLTTDGTITLNTTNLTFVQFSSAGQSIAGNGLTKDGNAINAVGTTNRISVSSDAIDISTNYVGQASITTLGTIATGTWNGTDIAVADGGTGSSTAGGARTNLAGDITGGTTSTPALARVASQTVTGVATSFDIDHNFNTRDVTVQVFDSATYDTVFTDVVRSSVNRVQVSFSVAPGASSYRVVVTG